MELERKLLRLLHRYQAEGDDASSTEHDREQAVLQCCRILVALALLRADDDFSPSSTVQCDSEPLF